MFEYFSSTSRWGVYQRKSCRTKKIRRENAFLVCNEVNSAKPGLKTSIQSSDSCVLIKSCLLNERPCSLSLRFQQITVRLLV